MSSYKITKQRCINCKHCGGPAVKKNNGSIDAFNQNHVVYYCMIDKYYDERNPYVYTFTEDTITQCKYFSRR